MADVKMPAEKPQHETLTTAYAKEYVGVPFRLLGSSWERFKSDFDFKDENVFAMRIDASLPVTARVQRDGKEVSNFAVYDEDAKEYIEAEYHDYETFEITRADGAKFRGRIVDHTLRSWDDGNFQLLTSEGWQTVDYNSLAASKEESKERIRHESRLKVVHFQPVSFMEPLTLRKKTVQRAKLELTKTAYEALLQRANTLAKADVDPKNYVYAFTYVEADKQYVIAEEDYRKLTDAERETAAKEDESAASSSIDALSPPSGGGRASDFPFPEKDQIPVDEIPF